MESSYEKSQATRTILNSRCKILRPGDTNDCTQIMFISNVSLKKIYYWYPMAGFGAVKQDKVLRCILLTRPRSSQVHFFASNSYVAKTQLQAGWIHHHIFSAQDIATNIKGSEGFQIHLLQGWAGSLFQRNAMLQPTNVTSAPAAFILSFIHEVSESEL